MNRYDWLQSDQTLLIYIDEDAQTKPQPLGNIIVAFPSLFPMPLNVLKSAASELNPTKNKRWF